MFAIALQVLSALALPIAEVLKLLFGMDGPRKETVITHETPSALRLSDDELADSLGLHDGSTD